MIVLLGYMGSGKSLIGKKLARIINQPYLDLDQLIEEAEGITVSQIFSQKGEIAFRKSEAKVLQTTLDDHTQGVLALGGGTPCYAGNMDRILKAEGVVSIYLKANLEVLVERLWSERQQRPLIAHTTDRESLKDFIRKHLFDRSPYYMQANLRIDTSRQSPDEVVAKIVAELF